jgi:hypothetical protein
VGSEKRDEEEQRERENRQKDIRNETGRKMEKKINK